MELFKILHKITKKTIFEHKSISFKACVEIAIKNNANLSDADLSDADLYNANLRDADLSDANLYNANLRNANLYNANLRDADLRNADLYNANLRDADLRDADLSDADLYNANLYNANLHDANLRNADLRNAKNFNFKKITFLNILFEQPGKIRAYKMVDAKLKSPIQTNNTIQYKIGQKIIDTYVNKDIFTSCGAGINLADANWIINNWRPNYRILIAEFFAVDIACIPVNNDGKFRVSQCTIIGEKDPKDFGI